MTERSETLVQELWEEEDGRTMVCEAGSAGDAARKLLAPRARLMWVFEARSHFDAMRQYYDHMDWGQYTTDQPSDHEPYPPEWIVKQREALAAQMNNRDVIAASHAARAWREAAADLGIRFESPFPMQRHGATYWCAGLLPDFGGPRGAIIASRQSHDDVFDVAEALGFYASGLSPYHYETYERASFVETLNDWGWFGDASRKPSWFAGAVGRHGGKD